MSRRSRPPRAHKARGRDSEAPPREVSGVVPIAHDGRDARHDSGVAPAPVDELAALDAGWDELLVG